MDTVYAKFSVGQIVHHKLFGYRGVIIDVDPEFRGTDEWYRKMAPSRPPKDKPWYKVLHRQPYLRSGAQSPAGRLGRPGHAP